MRTYDLDGFVDTLNLLLTHAKSRTLVSCSINLDPTGLGHYAFKLLDGTEEQDFDASDAPEETPPTAPGKLKR